MCQQIDQHDEQDQYRRDAHNQDAELPDAAFECGLAAPCDDGLRHVTDLGVRAGCAHQHGGFAGHNT